jgi:hypothetical protein
MSDFKVSDGSIGGQAIDATSTTTRDGQLGRRVVAKDMDKNTNYGMGEFIYCKGVVNTVVGSVVLINMDDFSTSLAVANDVGIIGLAMSANVANQYGWYQVYGKGVATVLALFADNASCFLTATAGSIDDTDVAGDAIIGMKGASAVGTPAAGLAEVELSYPTVTDQL